MPGNPLTDPNWAPDLANTVDRLVGTVRDNVTQRAVSAVRAIVFGAIIGITGIALLVVAVIGGTKLLQRLIALPLDRDTSIWVSYLVMAGLFLLVGTVCMRKRFSRGDA